MADSVTDIDLEAHGKLFREHMSSLGFKDERSFEKNASSLMVTLVGERIALVPDDPHPGGGYATATEPTEYCPPTPDEVGAAILQQRSELRRS